jgi:hypothetical protein
MSEDTQQQQNEANEMPIPPANFSFLVLSLKTQAEIQMGLIHFGDEKDQPAPEFRVARHTIDMLAMLEEKTKGNLTMDEQRLIENSLTELRFRFVQALQEHKPQESEKTEGQAQG